MTRILVHGGFHKTGTTSLQDYLDLHRTALAPELAICLRQDMPGLAQATHAYSRRLTLLSRLALRTTLREGLSALEPAPARVISWEGLFGMMPGQRRKDRRMVTGYAETGPAMARDLDRLLTRRFGREAEITYLLTTRAGEAWVKSLWHHHLRNTRMTEDYESFRAHFGTTPDLARDAALIQEALTHRHVHVVPLEEVAGDPAGPARAVFDILGLAPALPPARRSHAAVSADLHLEFLALNRRIADKAELQKTKRRMLRAARATSAS